MAGKQRSGGRDQGQGLKLVLALVAVLVVAAMALGAVLLNRGTGDPEVAADDRTAADTATDEATEAATTGTDGDDALEPCPPATNDVPAPTTEPYDEQPTADLGDAESVTATITTTCGEVVVALDAAAAPATVANFVALAEDGYYRGVGFHRVIDEFMVQGGDPTGTGSGCLDEACSTRLPGYQFADELELAEEVVAETGGYPRGTLAMANAGPDTNGSQFFIVQATPGYPLPPAYAVFGEVVAGMDVVDRIALGPVDGQLAVDPVRILDVTIER